MRLTDLSWGALPVVMALVAGMPLGGAAQEKNQAATFGEEVAFMKKHLKDVIVLEDEAGQAKVAVAPQYQGRVMTSTAAGDAGQSFGWINRELIGSGKLSPQFNAFGGEDRFWMGPEGGQFALYFKKGDPFDLAHWQVPPVIDSEAYEVIAQAPGHVVFQKQTSLLNASGTKLELKIERRIEIIPTQKMALNNHGLKPGAGVKAVGYCSVNTITNAGQAAWTKETGMPSIWILGMYNPSPGAVIVIPFKKGSVEELGPVVNDTYFGKIPAERLKVGDGVIFFKGDGKQRGKIGLSPRRATEFAGAYDTLSKTLTIVRHNQPQGAADYVNSMWEIQKEPFTGDEVNAYNDGPTTPGGKPLGPFIEVETSSPAAALAPGESLTHVHATFHFQGDAAELDKIARATLGTGITQIEEAFEK